MGSSEVDGGERKKERGKFSSHSSKKNLQDFQEFSRPIGFDYHKIFQELVWDGG